MTATVKVNTSDVAWIERHGIDREDMAVAYGIDIRGVMYFTTSVRVADVEHVKFAGAAMVRFDLGPDAPRDHSRWAMYPESYLVRSTP